MGWAVSYQLVRAEPLSDDERAAVAAHAARFARHPWPIEPYAPTVGDGAVVVAGVTKMPWSTTTPAWGWLLAALTELRTLIAGARCEVSDDHEAISWSEASQRYAVPPITIAPSRAPRPRGPRTPRPPGAPGGARIRCVRVEPHQRHSHVVIRDEDVLRFELRGTRARLDAGLFVRTAIAASIDHAAARLLAADGDELEVVERARWSGFELATEVSARLAMMEIVARTVTPCDGFPVARLAVGALGADGAVALAPVDGWPRYPRGTFVLAVRPTAAGIAVDCDGRDERLLLQRDLAIDFIVFTGGGAELARASVVGGLADHHVVEIPLAPTGQAEVRRFDVRVTGAVVQTASVGRWQLVRARAAATQR
ncbi:MAG: hypothetical protein JNK64_06785 [Myxococcales bacterium]|nr:hypothetical protein [Myxococcales bacterium]